MALSGTSCLQLTQDCLRLQRTAEQWVHAYLWVDGDRAMEAARGLDGELERGARRGPLHGATVAVKDVVDVARMPTTAGSRVLADAAPASADAAIVAALRAAGCVIVGKTNTHEFAYGATTPPTRNPLDPDRIAGGSSGGSAAAIASGSACLAVGTDTGGSVRLPAALCGVAGFRPRRNAIGTEGVIPLAPEFDQWGLLAASAEVLELAWSALSGRPAPGPHVVPQLVAPASLVTTLPAVEHSVAAAFEAALAASGLDVIRERMPSLSEWLAPRMAIQMEQALATHRRAGWWPSLRDRYSAEVRRNLKIAEAQTADLHAARARLRELDAEIDRLLRGGAVIATPTVPIKAPLVSEVEAMPQRADARHPIVSILASATLPFSRSDLASLTVPVWHGSHPLPASVQMVAQDESLVFAAARRMPRRLGS